MGIENNGKREAGLVGIERGWVSDKKTDNGVLLYKVKSATRWNVQSRWIEAFASEPELNIGDKVYFFLFDDGRGEILNRVES